MSAARIAKLEELLAKVQRNAIPRESIAGGAAAMPGPTSPTSALSRPPLRETAELDIEVSSRPTPIPVADEVPSRPSQPTPLEAALSGELESGEPELEIIVDADDDEPELVVEEPILEPPMMLDETPTAPLGTRAEASTPVRASRPRTLDMESPLSEKPAAPVVVGEPSASEPSEPMVPRRVAQRAPAAS
ncbi:MAG: hypothetical protein AB7P00_20015, partial [Sandaracinaceae bacterium]